MSELNKNLLYDKLTDAFINYQHRLELPFPSTAEELEKGSLKYRSDSIFNAKVKSMVAGVLHIIDEVERTQGE